MFALCAKIAWEKLTIKHIWFFFSSFNDLHLSTVTEPALEVPSSNKCSWKGPSLKYTSQTLIWHQGSSPHKYPLVSQWPMFMKRQYLLSHYMHWKNRLIRVTVQLPHLRDPTSLLLWRRQPFLCLLCAELPCAAGPASLRKKVKWCTERLWRAVSRIKQAVESPRTDWYV